MSKLFLAMFGGTPARGELCLYLNAAVGLYNNCDGIQCYPIDKDTESPNYINTRNLYNQYQAFREIVRNTGTGMASVDVIRTEDTFEDMLNEANIASEEESIKYLMARDYGLTKKDERVLNICFTKEEQMENMKGGYYGKANIGSVTGDVLIQRGIYQKLNLCRDIGTNLNAGYELDVVIICSSFGGTGASLGINFGEYLKKTFKKEEKLRIHCIHIQPYFSFPDPKEEDEWKMDCKQFYAKSATVTTILGQKKNFIKKDDQDAIFDRFYYLGQEVLDKISDENSAVSKQDNHIHMVDMLVSLAVQDILIAKDETELQIYGYQYANKGTDLLTWIHMPSGIGFKTKHVCMMRFCEFMLDCMEPIFADDYKDYNEDFLIIHLYGQRSIFNKTADITEGIKTQFHNDMKKCFDFCRSYVEYWVELENTTKLGNIQSSAICFFNIDELNRILERKEDEYHNVRYSANNLKLTETKAFRNYERGHRCLEIYDSLCSERCLRGIARPGCDKMSVARNLIQVIYEKCAVENYRIQQD